MLLLTYLSTSLHLSIFWSQNSQHHCYLHQLNRLQLIQHSLVRELRNSFITPALHWLKLKERIDYKILFLAHIQSLLPPNICLSSTLSQYSFLWCCHPCSSTLLCLFESQQPLIPPCLTSSVEWTFWRTSPSCRWWMPVTGW